MNADGGSGQGINTSMEKAIAAKGGWVQLSVKATEKLSVNLTYGIDDPDEGDLNNGDRDENSTIMANVWYAFDSSVVVGLEYSYMTTEYKKADTANNNRIQGCVMYKF